MLEDLHLKLFYEFCSAIVTCYLIFPFVQASPPENGLCFSLSLSMLFVIKRRTIKHRPKTLRSTLLKLGLETGEFWIHITQVLVLTNCAMSPWETIVDEVPCPVVCLESLDFVTKWEHPLLAPAGKAGYCQITSCGQSKRTENSRHTDY